MRKIYFVFVTIALLAIAGCSQNDDFSADSGTSTRTIKYDNSIIHVTVDSIVGQTVTLSAFIKSEGLTINKRGFVWSIKNNKPVIGGKSVLRLLDFTGKDTISNTLNTTYVDTYYYIRGYAITNTADTIYSDIDSFMISSIKPQIETMPITNRVRIAAIVLGRFTDYGNVTINSFGICMNRKGYPTMNDQYIAAIDTAVDTSYKGQFGAFFDSLTANTMYHVRAYCIYTVNSQKDTIYANDRIFKTTFGGDVQWTWGDKSSDATVNARITQAMDSAMYYYNNYSNLYHRITANYNSGVATADCTLSGWMRFGPVATYQWVGTAQHEISHAMGVGTAWNWSSFGDPWSKPVATQTIRVLLKDMAQNIHGSYSGQIHFWPGGINYRSEVENPGTSNTKGVVFSGVYMLKVNAMMCNALREDGLASYY
jgi:hypothetical protein